MDYQFHTDPRNKDPRKEDAIQAAFLRDMRMVAPKVLLVGVPNAGKRSAWEGRQRKREGLRKGFPDIMALWNGMSAFLEFKSGVGSMKPEQIDMLNDLTRHNFPCGMFRDEQTAIAWLQHKWPQAFVVAP